MKLTFTHSFVAALVGAIALLVLARASENLTIISVAAEAKNHVRVRYKLW